MKRRNYLAPLLSGLILLLTSSLVACSQPPTAIEQPPETEEIEESKERPIYVSSLAWELRVEILRQDLSAFLKKYPIKHFQPEDEPEAEKVWIHELHFGRGGNYYMLSRIPADNVYQAERHLENASSLLDKGKLPNEVESRPLDKNEVAEELEEAQSLLIEQRASSSTWQKNSIEWAKQPHGSDISNEQTIEDIIETYDDYRQRLSKIISKVDYILSELPKAIEG